MKLRNLPFGRWCCTTAASLSLLLLNSNHANAQCVQATGSTTSTALIASVANPGRAYDLSDGDATTAATLTVSGVGAATLNVSFDQQANKGDSIIILFGIPTANILDWGSLGGTDFTPYSGTGGYGSASGTVSAGTLSFIIAVGSNSLARIAVPVTNAAGAQSLKITFTGLGLALNKTNFIYDVAVKPGPMVATSPTICYGTATTLSASYDALTTQKIDVLWYDADGSTILQTTSNLNGAPVTNTFTTPILTATKTYYVRERWNGCALLSDPTPVTVTVRPQITPAISVACLPARLTTTTTNGTGPFSYAWTTSGNGNIVSGSNTASPTISRPGTYSVQITDANGCIGTASRIVNATDCIALPLHLLTFTAAPQEGHVLLNWTVANENKIAGFGIEHSMDSKTWSEIGSVSQGTENSSNPGASAYTWVHQTPAAGMNYYRLKSVESDGSISYSLIKAVKENGGIADVIVYPNPVQNQLNIKLPKAPTEPTILSIYSADGKQLYSEPVNGTQQHAVPTNALGSGVYFLKVYERGLMIYHTRFVKQ